MLWKAEPESRQDVVFTGLRSILAVVSRAFDVTKVVLELDNHVETQVGLLTQQRRLLPLRRRRVDDVSTLVDHHLRRQRYRLVVAVLVDDDVITAFHGDVS